MRKKAKKSAKDRRKNPDFRYGLYLPDQRKSLRRASDIYNLIENNDDDDDGGSQGGMSIEQLVIEQQRQRFFADLLAREKEHNAKQGRGKSMLASFDNTRKIANVRKNQEREADLNRKANNMGLSSPYVDNTKSAPEKILQWQKSIGSSKTQGNFGFKPGARPKA